MKATTFWSALIGCICTATLAARAEYLSEELPKGTFVSKDRRAARRLSLAILPKHRLRLTLGKRVLRGRYRVRYNKFSSYGVDVWIFAGRASRRLVPTALGALLHPGRHRFAFNFQCQRGRESVQVCLHDGSSEKTKLGCVKLIGPKRPCRSKGPPPGVKVNQPSRHSHTRR